jgi:hypothetical protein
MLGLSQTRMDSASYNMLADAGKLLTEIAAAVLHNQQRI